MNKLVSGYRGILIYTAVVFTISVGYFIYAQSVYPPTPERETFLTDLGEGFGELGLWVLIFIYLRTALKLLLGKGPIARRILPEYTSPIDASLFNKIIYFLDKTNIYFGIATVAIFLMHIALMGIPMNILFFPAVLALIIWQGVFGMFISWRYTPRELKKFSYLVHAQFVTGTMLGISRIWVTC